MNDELKTNLPFLIIVAKVSESFPIGDSAVHSREMTPIITESALLTADSALLEIVAPS